MHVFLVYTLIHIYGLMHRRAYTYGRTAFCVCMNQLLLMP